MTTNQNNTQQLGETMNTDLDSIVQAVLAVLQQMDKETTNENNAKKSRELSRREAYERTRLWWSDDENAVLRVGVEMNRTNGEIAAFLGRTKMGVRKQKARVFGS